MKNLAIALALLAGVTGAAQAAGDAAAGQTKSATCVACHGADGNSPADIYPKIAGQHPSYIKKQLVELKAAATGKAGRASPIMGPMAMPLSEQDMDDLAAYFGSQERTPVPVPDEVVVQGRALYMGGDMSRGLAACIACHGPRGEGLEQAKYPNLTGQHPAYIKAQLEAFRAGTRDNDPNGMMRDVAKKLTDDDIKVLSQYVAGLH
ncbi:cytochrome c [Aeromonas schubertii]|uniref:Cytochrome C n=1 Tax=Aeromonas schubertii TaxID=652 RepID=A0A0S2SPQ1_9GAMM|nr:c-type cytochrome [Aeromonas schubertii]ALP43660.1 cytochrome C [Aeromonas schubertii]KUE81153.1 cytochrome C [Aeromonas schubertii]MBZ6073401.1 cytochrome c4 [Aeromonas schubertii]